MFPQYWKSKKWSARRCLPGTDRLRVLIVDDYQDGAEGLVLYLSLDGIDAQAVRNDGNARTVARAWRPEIIVIDVAAPSFTGAHLARSLRRDESPDAIMIAFTVLSEDEIRPWDSVDYFDGYCEKGQPPVALTELMAQFLDRDADTTSLPPQSKCLGPKNLG